MEIHDTAGALRQDTAGAQKAREDSTGLDYQAFLQLLIAQMRNQDPTSPMDPTAQVAQLASLSQVEQAIQTNAKLDALMTSAALSQADSVIGRTVTSADGGRTGEAVGLRIAATGAVAIMADGSELPLSPGVTIT